MNLNPKNQNKREHNKKVTAYRTLLTTCYWEDVTCVLWSCRYGREVIYGHAYQLERKLHGGRGERNGEEQERERDNSQHQENITAISFIFL